MFFFFDFLEICVNLVKILRGCFLKVENFKGGVDFV